MYEFLLISINKTALIPMELMRFSIFEYVHFAVRIEFNFRLSEIAKSPCGDFVTVFYWINYIQYWMMFFYIRSRIPGFKSKKKFSCFWSQTISSSEELAVHIRFFISNVNTKLNSLFAFCFLSLDPSLFRSHAREREWEREHVYL